MASTKKKLVKDVAELIHHAYPIPDTRVSLREWPAEQTSVDGELGHQPMRPICTPSRSARAAIRRQTQARRASQLRNRRVCGLPGTHVAIIERTDWLLSMIMPFLAAPMPPSE